MNDYEKFEELCDKIFKKIEKDESVQGISTAGLYIILGSAYFYKGNYEAAKKVFNKMLSEYEGQEVFFLNVYLLLGNSDSYIGNFDQAIKTFDKGLSISLTINRGVNGYTLRLYEAKLRAYLDKGDYKRSIELCNKYLKTLLHKFESQHNYTVLIYSCLGMLYKNIGDFIEAKSNYLKALDIAIKAFKEDDIIHESIYNNLGMLFLSQENNVDKGIGYCNRALTILLKIFHKDHPRLLETYLNLVMGHLSKFDFQKVIELCKIGLDILSRTSTKESLMFGLFCFYLGISYFITGNKELSISYTNKALKAFLSICGKQHMLTINAYNLLVEIYQMKGDYDRALEILNDLSNSHESMPKERNVFTVSRYIISGNIYGLKKDYSNAKAAYEQALEISLNVYGELHLITAWEY